MVPCALIAENVIREMKSILRKVNDGFIDITLKLIYLLKKEETVVDLIIIRI
jgi:hypothetical protein